MEQDIVEKLLELPKDKTFKYKKDVYNYFNECLGKTYSEDSWKRRVVRLGISDLVLSFIADKEEVGNNQQLIDQINFQLSDVEIDGVNTNSFQQERIDELAIQLLRLYEQRTAQQQIRNNQSIRINGNKIVIAAFSDSHFGDHINYANLLNITKKVVNTPGMYALHNGDITDNFIEPRFLSIMLNRTVSIEDEIALATNWLKSMITPNLAANKANGSLLAILEGNHDLYTKKQSGISWVKQCLSLLNAKSLYAENQLAFTLKFDNSYEQKVLMRHHFTGNTTVNPHKGMIDHLIKADDATNDADIVLSGHIHSSTLVREQVIRAKTRLLILLNTLKENDPYSDECGFAPDNGVPMAFICFDVRNKHRFVMTNVDSAVEWVKG